MRDPQLALEYLVTCSQTSLEGFELARLNQISSFRKQLGELQDQWIEAEVAARLARLLLEHRRAESPSSADSPALLSNISVLQRLSCEPAGAAELHATAELQRPLTVSRESSLQDADSPVVENSEELEAPVDCRPHESLALRSASSDRADVSTAVKTNRSTRRSRTSLKSASISPAAPAPVTPPAGRSQPPAKVLSSNLLLFVAAGSPTSPPASREPRRTNAGQLSLFVRGSENFEALRPLEFRKSRQRRVCSKSPVSRATRTGAAGRGSVSRLVSRQALSPSRRLAPSA